MFAYNEEHTKAQTRRAPISATYLSIITRQFMKRMKSRQPMTQPRGKVLTDTFACKYRTYDYRLSVSAKRLSPPAHSSSACRSGVAERFTLTVYIFQPQLSIPDLHDLFYQSFHITIIIARDLLVPS